MDWAIVMTQVIELRTEEIAWEILAQAVRREIDCENITLSFAEADWANFNVVFSGEIFRHSLTTSTMKGLIDFQNAIYKTIGIIIRNDERISLFSNDEKTKYELIFEVKDGSSDVSTDGKNKLIELTGEAVKKMSGRQLVIVIISCALLWFGSQSFNNYIQNTVEEKKIDASKDKDKALVELASKVSSDDLEKMHIMADALKASPRTREINELKEQAIDSII